MISMEWIFQAAANQYDQTHLLVEALEVELQHFAEIPPTPHRRNQPPSLSYLMLFIDFHLNLRGEEKALHYFEYVETVSSASLCSSSAAPGWPEDHRHDRG